MTVSPCRTRGEGREKSPPSFPVARSHTKTPGPGLSSYGQHWPSGAGKHSHSSWLPGLQWGVETLATITSSDVPRTPALETLGGWRNPQSLGGARIPAFRSLALKSEAAFAEPGHCSSSLPDKAANNNSCSLHPACSRAPGGPRWATLHICLP